MSVFVDADVVSSANLDVHVTAHVRVDVMSALMWSCMEVYMQV